MVRGSLFFTLPARMARVRYEAISARTIAGGLFSP